MSLVNCPECQHQISNTAPACPHCGNKKKSNLLRWLIITPIALVVAFLGFGFIIGQSPEAKEKAQARDAITQCWQSQQKQSLDDSSKQLIAGACESMEQKFINRYHVKP